MRSGELCGSVHEQRHARHVGKCEGERMPVGKQEAKSMMLHCAGYFAEEHGLPRADHRTCRRNGRDSPCRTCVLIATASPARFGWSLLGMKRNSATDGVLLVAASTIWRAPNRVLVIQDHKNRRNAKVFRAHAAPQGMCDNLSNALKLLANQQKDGDSPVKMVVQGLLKIMDGPRKCNAVDNRAEKIGDLEKLTWSRGR